MNKLRLIFMGTPEFAVPSLKALTETPHEIVAVITRPDTAKGRGLAVIPSPVKAFALEKGLNVLQPEKLSDPAFKEQLLALKPDLTVIVAFKILPMDVIRIPRLGSINLHASLLPKYRGAAPIQRAIAAGETKTGLTVFFLGDVIDGGEMIKQVSVEIGPDETAGDLSNRLKEIGAGLLAESVNAITEGNVRTSRQDASLSCPAPKLKKDEGKIDFTLPANEIYNRIRAFTPVPGAFTFLNGRRILVTRAVFSGEPGSGRPGSVVSADASGIRVGAGSGTVTLLSVKPENKKEMTARDFINGFHVSQNDLFSD